MNDLLCYKTMPIWRRETLPEAFTQKHNTQAGTWAKLTLLKGTIDFDLMTEEGKTTESFTFTPENQPPFIEPLRWHRISGCSDDAECQLAFYCRPEDFYAKKYAMTRTHSEVIEAMGSVQPGKALDLGCGGGRNSLYLNLKGFEVTAWDKNPQSVARLNQVISEESLRGISASVADINSQRFSGEYDFILSTVVFMFLDGRKVPDIIHDMQNSTRSGGYNLIVSAVADPDFPAPDFFSFGFQPGELRDYYRDWQTIKYNEDIGHLHKTDENGNRIALRFVTMLAKKPE